MTSTNAKKQTPQAKCWCYTLNNPKAPIQFNESTMTYLVYGEEKGKEGTFHHQGFVVFKQQKRLSNMKDINGSAHWEIKSPKSTFAQASEYCKKDGKYYEFGILPEEPRIKGNDANKSKWREINDKAKSGDLDWIDEKYPKVFNQSYKNIKQMKVDYMKRKPNLPDVCGIWIYGKSGVGKTHILSEVYPDAYLKRAQNKWFDAYQQEDVVALDDLDDTHAYMGYELKKLADKYCYMVEVKNSSMYIRPSKCVVTSQYTIAEIWKNDPRTVEALKRRFQQIEVTVENRESIIAMLKQQGKPLVQEDISAEQFDALMTEARAAQAELINKQNEAIRKKDIRIEELPKKLKPTNVYFPDKRLQFKAPVDKKLVRKNAMVTPPIPKPLVVPPPAPKKRKHEVIELDDEDVEEDRYLGPSPPDDDYVASDVEYDSDAYYEHLYANEQIDSSPDDFSDEY